jgi:intracellular sulfur oxidation DsrE/DsrF family protein
MVRIAIIFALVSCFLAATPASSQWAAPKSPVIPEADGYVSIPHAAIPPEKDHVYRAIFNGTMFASDSTALLPAINNAGSELNAFGVSGIPSKNIKFVIVFHGPAMQGLLDDAHYKARYGVSNPNLKVLAELKKAGVELFVCGQNLAAENIDPKILTPDVMVASDALIVLMKYQNSGYALLEF